MQAPSRRKGPAATESEARQEPPTNEGLEAAAAASRSASRGKTKRNTSSTATTDGSTRSGSQPKQRGALPSKPKVPTQTPYEVALAKMKKAAQGKPDEQQEVLLQQLLQQQQFEDAAYLIAASPFLAAKYHASDVIRLVIDAKQFEKAAQLIRDMKLQANQLLVTLFIRALVQCSLFQSAVRYAEEMVEHFGKKDFAASDPSRPAWTPQALIQAMIRAQQFRSALKYAKQFDLLDVFPPAQLIASMFEMRSWEEAVSSVLEYRLFDDFPLEVLVQRLLQARQWNNAIKCINKLPTKELVDRYYEALVREAARVGDFVTSIRYLREFKLDSPEDNGMLLKYIVDCMIGHREMYKAIKYSIKFGLNVPDADAEETGELSVYDTDVLIRKAIEYGQYHVAVTYIKKLKLKDAFTAELEAIQRQQDAMIREFHQFVQARESQYQHPQVQRQLIAIVGTDATDQLVDQHVELEVVLSSEEEVFPRKAPRQTAADEAPEPPQPTEVNGAAHREDPVAEAPRKASRFSFARAESDAKPSASVAAPPPPPGLSFQSTQSPQQQQNTPQPPAPRAPPPGLAQQVPQSSAPSSSSFDFAQFAATLQSGTGGGAPPPPAPPQYPHMAPQQGMNHLFPHQSMPPLPSQAPSRSGPFYPPPPPPPPQFNGNPGYLSGPMPPPPPPPLPHQQGGPMFFHQQPQPGFAHPPPASNGPLNNSNFDITSLTMQFHSRPPQPPAYSNQFHQSGPPLPPGIPGGLFPSMGPPLPLQQPPPPPPQPQFSMSYTSVTTTRQKRA